MYGLSYLVDKGLVKNGNFHSYEIPNNYETYTEAMICFDNMEIADKEYKSIDKYLNEEFVETLRLEF